MKTGSIIAYKDKKDLSFAWVSDGGTERLRVVSERGKEFGFPADKVLVRCGSGPEPGSSREAILESLRRARLEAAQIQVGTLLPDLWELLTDDSGERLFELEELAREYFGSVTTPAHEAALLAVLLEDSVYFKQKGRAYATRSPDQVQEILRQHAVEEQREKERQATLEWLRRIDRGGVPEAPPPGSERFIQLLKGWAIHQEGYDQVKEATALLRELGPSEPSTAFDYLVSAGIWGPDENLLMHRFQVPVEFPREALACEDDALARFASVTGLAATSGRREDLTGLETFTIDDEDTTDIDDALSLEPGAGGLRVGIHIADATALVENGDPMDMEAQRRGSTLYLPEGKVPMLPPRLSDDVASLVAGRDRLAVSVLVDLSPALDVEGFTLAESVIRVRHRLTYEEVDRVLAAGPGRTGAQLVSNEEGDREDEHHGGSPDRWGEARPVESLPPGGGVRPGPVRAALASLLELAHKLRNERIAAGALIFNVPEVKIRVVPGGQPTVKKILGETPAHLLVSEMMILANRLVARWVRDRGAPGIYRFQPAPEEALAINGYDPVQHYRVRRLIKKSESSTRPMPHAGLGLELYTQFTSPIRRYLDIVLHRQVKSLLAGGGPLYDPGELESVIAGSERSQDVIGMIQRQSHRYWLLKHLAGLTGTVVPAVVLDRKDDPYVILLTDFQLETLLHARPDSRFEVGQHIMVRIDRAQPRRGQLRVVEG